MCDGNPDDSVTWMRTSDFSSLTGPVHTVDFCIKSPKIPSRILRQLQIGASLRHLLGDFRSDRKYLALPAAMLKDHAKNDQISLAISPACCNMGSSSTVVIAY